jgi:hypothetical protein
VIIGLKIWTTKKLTGVVFLDIRKAFDSIDHEILLEKLKFYGITGVEHNWLESYLTSRNQQTFVNGFLSTKKEINVEYLKGQF